MKCCSAGKTCVFDDDFNDLAPKLVDAGVIIFATPVYWYTLPAQVQGSPRQNLSLVVGRKGIAGKGYATIICCEEDDMSVIAAPGRRSAAQRRP